MKALKVLIEQQIAFGLVMCLVVPFGAAETNPGFHTAQTTGTAPVGATQSFGQETVVTMDIATGVTPTAYPDRPATALSQSATPLPQNQAAQTSPAQQDTPSPAPAGTAAAPYEKQEGVSASNPAGSAIAPGKQRRIRSFAIRVGLLVGAAVAIGVVAGASLGSSSRP